ncbi:MAG: hypothetical protein AB1416_03370 [Actinomycetota bacterium]
MGSPRILGTLQLDRTPPQAEGPSISSDVDGTGTAEVRWTQGDGGLSGTDPAQPIVVERNTSPGGDDGGLWEAVPSQPATGGDGPKSARLPTALLPDGAYLLRVRSTDRAGNAGARTLGAVRVDRRAPVVTGVRVVRGPTAADRSADIAFTAADPQPGSGLAPDGVTITGPGGAPVHWRGTAGPGETTAHVALPAAGTHTLIVRATDVAGRTGESGPVDVTVPPGTGAGATGTTPGRTRTLPAPLTAPRRAAPRGAAAVYAALRRYHARRGTPLTARLTATASTAEWRRILGDDAPRYDGYTSFAGDVLLGPATVRALDELWRGRHARRAPGRAAADRITRALAVAMHETIHATGPTDQTDFATDPGRALEEGLAEAAAVDHLPRFIATLDTAPAVRRALRAATRRYRPAYRPQVDWIRSLSQRATRTPAAWRITAADTWGGTRWDELAAATGTPIPDLRAAIPPVTDHATHR